ncbi:acyl carrier protein [Streptomyces bacillaris]|uniref:Acyl carrier protein n=2 Tax=Streptomyces TaxID=1883 RepID=A0AAD0QA37_9ACTN|nr:MULTISPECIES: acyl carrier protein [Streptomyces]MYR37702.1 acyl carrier protein [Streptomyces sp. SID4944]ATY99315.1 acyl carrier protein [Streptomyces cavourensis]AXI75146.1 acyl carrier protein [Streptomyces cavourensis]MBH0242938.1 acyl carrier protein [Streptomyces cavourensis]MBT3073216.1 acyl carrier protein [Streptomyces sp. COG21]
MTTMSDLTRTTVVTRINESLGHVLKRDLEPADESPRLFDDLGLDSTSVLELLMRLEDELGIEFDTDSLEQHHFDSVGTLADYVIEQA